MKKPKNRREVYRFGMRANTLGVYLELYEDKSGWQVYIGNEIQAKFISSWAKKRPLKELKDVNKKLTEFIKYIEYKRDA